MTRFPGVPSQRWTPSDLGSSLVAWFDASVTTSVTTATGGVSQWDDLSGNGYHATQGTSGNRPDSVTDGIDFVPTNSDRLLTGVPNRVTARCVAAVVQPDALTGTMSIFGQNGVDTAWILRILSTDVLQITFAGIADIGSSTALLTAGANNVVLGNTSASAFRLSVNGTATTGTHTRSLPGGGTSTIGSHATQDYLDGKLREVVICGALATDDQERLEGYLAWKWNLVSSLASGHPYKSQQP